LFGWSGVFRRQQRRLKPRAYAYRRKPGRDEQDAKSKTRTIPVRMCAEIVFASRLPVLLWVKRWPSIDCTWRGF
jgi:hypothetical protein